MTSKTQDFVHCLERQIINLNVQGDKNSSSGDPYGGLMFYDDATLLQELCDLLIAEIGRHV